LALGISLVAIALAGIATHRNLIAIMLGMELIFVASTIVLVSFFDYNSFASSSGIILLFSIWTVAAVEIITVIALYVYMKSRGLGLDVSKLSKMKW
jgi:NADH:ubiquinone oxidoreductase subunit K